MGYDIIKNTLGVCYEKFVIQNGIMSFDGAKIFNLCKNLQGKVEGFEGMVLSMLADCYEMGWALKKTKAKQKNIVIKRISCS